MTNTSIIYFQDQHFLYNYSSKLPFAIVKKSFPVSTIHRKYQARIMDNLYIPTNHCKKIPLEKQHMFILITNI